MAGNCFLILGVRTDATLAEIKAAFRRRAMELHPDRTGSEGGPFIELRKAYTVLSNPELRRRHERELRVTERRLPRRPGGEPFSQPAMRSEPFTTPRCSLTVPVAEPDSSLIELIFSDGSRIRWRPVHRFFPVRPHRTDRFW